MTFHHGKGHSVSMMESEPLDPAAVLRDAARHRHTMAARAVAPTWFYPTVGVLTGALIAAQSTRNGWITIAAALCYSAGLGAAVVAYRRGRGVSVQHRDSRAGVRIAALVAGCAVTIVVASVIEYGFDARGALIVAGVVIAAGIALVGPAADRAYVQDQHADIGTR